MSTSAETALDVAAAARPPLTWELDSMAMESCSASRDSGDPTQPGTVSISHEIQSHFADDEMALIYLVQSTATFTDTDAEVAALIKVSFALAYDVGGVEPKDADVEDFRSSVILQVTPFVREFLASTTNRLGLVPFLLPLSRNPELDSVPH